MATGLIGALRVTLGIDASEFVAGTKKSQAELRGFQREFERTGKKFQSIGKDFSKWVTLPVAAAGAAVVKMAGDFQASMIQVGINANASKQQLAQMREQALMIGKDTAKSASEAADAMNILAKTGMSATDILNGAAKAAVDLSIATGSELDPAAAAISDTFKQFNKNAKDLPGIINTITGAVNESKFDFADFQLGMSQAGAVAGAVGISFEDFAAALAGTSSMFASGSDAGTSFKTFLLHLEPQTKKAAALMDQYGLSFYKANGEMKSLREMADMLQKSLGGLSDQDRNEVMLKVFGTDGVRTAIGLMKLGSQGIDEMNARIQNTSAADQAAARMQGFNGQLEQLKGALETLAIRIADSGLLEFITELVKWAGDVVDKLGQLNPTMLKWATIIAGVAAAFGPFMLVFGGFIRAVGIGLPLLMKLGPVFQVLATGIGYLIPVVAGLARVLIAGLLANPILAGAALLITGIYLAWRNWDKIGPIVANMVNAVKGWLSGKLGPILDWVNGKVESVKNKFHDMYDAVVGHSYVPDMVDEIGQHMRRLDKEMVAPATKSTSAATQAFQQMQQEVSSILDRLYPEQAETNRFNRDLETLSKGMAKLGFNADQAADARMRLWGEHYKNQTGVDPMRAQLDPSIENPQVLDELPGAAQRRSLKDIVNGAKDANKEIANDNHMTTAQMAEEWANMASDVVSSLRGMVQSFKSGDILGGIEQMVDMIGSVLRSLTQLGVIKTPTGTGGWGGGGTKPGFSTGGSFQVGGSGGVDSQLVQFRATPGEQVNVRRGDQMDQGASPVLHFDLRGAVMTQDLVQQMNAIGESAAQRGAVGGATLAARQRARSARSRLG